jgi:hypothetical protein
MSDLLFNGLAPLGFRKDGSPFYPIMGGASEPDEDDPETPEDEEPEEDPDDDAEPVTFKSKADFVKHVNGIVKGRVARVEKKYAPVVQERDTLKSKVAELSGTGGKPAPEAEQQISALSNQVKELLSFQQTAQRNELVRSIAKDHGLPDELLARVQGDDEDSITEDVEQLAELFKANGTPATKKKFTPETKPDDKSGKGGKGSGGKGGHEDDQANDLDKIASEVGRYGHRPVFVGRR